MDFIDRARAYLIKLPPAIAGQSGHAATFATACRLVEFGLSFEQATPLLAGWNQSHCRPRWTEAELKHKLADAFKCTSPKPHFVKAEAWHTPGPIIPMSGQGTTNQNASERALRSHLQPKGEQPGEIQSLAAKLRHGSQKDFAALAALRGLSVVAVALASKRGLLRFGQYRGHQAWFILDALHRIAQARRLDGQRWTPTAKAWTLTGSKATWPVGIGEAEKFPAIALLEGGPDLLAALHFLLAETREPDCAPVAMLGGYARIHSDALPMFTGKRVRIFRHTDTTGENAADRWAEQLAEAGADVDAFRFDGLRQTDGQPVNDLNDLANIHADDFEEHRCLWGLFNYARPTANG